MRRIGIVSLLLIAGNMLAMDYGMDYEDEVETPLVVAIREISTATRAVATATSTDTLDYRLNNARSLLANKDITETINTENPNPLQVALQRYSMVLDLQKSYEKAQKTDAQSNSQTNNGQRVFLPLTSEKIDAYKILIPELIKAGADTTKLNTSMQKTLKELLDKQTSPVADKDEYKKLK